MRHRFVLPHALVPLQTTLLRRTAMFAWVGMLWACRSAGDGSTAAPATSSVARGDHVVVEPRAAEFFEARVLSIGKSQLRVEPVGKHEGVLVSASDVYPLKPVAALVKAGQLAICHIGDAWTGCRVDDVHDEDVLVRTLQGEPARLRRSEIVVASAATELNLRRAFGKLSSRAEFEKAASRAGRPIAPAGYRVAPHGRVVALRASGWYSGVVADVHDDGAHVLFAPDHASEQIPLGDLVPEPPASAAPGRGDFALIRPPSPSEAWQVVRVVALEGRDFKVVGADSVPRLAPARDVLSLGPPASNDAR